MAELRPYNPTLRERTKQTIAGALTNLGMDNYMAQKTARGITGTTRPDLNMAEASGVLEFTPVGLAFGLDESARGLKTAQTPLDYAIEGTIGAVTLGESVAKALPFTAQTIKFLRNLKSKNKSIAEEIVDDQKRKTLKTMGKGALATVAAEPLIGALGNVPKSTVAKKVAKKVPELSKLKSFKTALNNLFIGEGKQFASLFTKKELKDRDINPNNITDEDFKELGKEYLEDGTFLMNDAELMSMDSVNIEKWLNDEIPLEAIDQGKYPFTSTILAELQNKYKLSKPDIKKYLTKEEIIGSLDEVGSLEIPDFGGGVIGGRMGNKQFIGHIRDSSQIDLAIEQFKKDNPQFANNKFSVIDTDSSGKKLPQAQVWIDDMPPEDLTE